MTLVRRVIEGPIEIDLVVEVGEDAELPFVVVVVCRDGLDDPDPDDHANCSQDKPPFVHVDIIKTDINVEDSQLRKGCLKKDNIGKGIFLSKKDPLK